MAFASLIVPGYTLISVICETGHFGVYRALSLDGKQFLLKVPVFSPPPALAIAQLEHEYQAARELDPAFAVRPLQLKREGGIIALRFWRISRATRWPAI